MPRSGMILLFVQQALLLLQFRSRAKLATMIATTHERIATAAGCIEAAGCCPESFDSSVALSAAAGSSRDPAVLPNFRGQQQESAVFAEMTTRGCMLAPLPCKSDIPGSNSACLCAARTSFGVSSRLRRHDQNANTFMRP